MESVQKNYREKHSKSIIKSISWRVIATLTTVCISYVVTGNAKFAFSIGSIEVVLKIILYYIHERFWMMF